MPRHADLTVTNKIVDDDFNIVGFLDWTSACTVPQQSFTVFHMPHDTRLGFLWPSRVAEVKSREKKQLIDDVKRFEDHIVRVSDVWRREQAAIAACLDCGPVAEKVVAPRLSMMVYRCNEQGAFSQFVESFSAEVASL